jgi:uncharacterized membrane protein YfcA
MAIIELIHPLAFVALLTAGLVRGLTGFGVGLLLAPALSIIYDASTAVVTVQLVDLPSSLYLLAINWRYADIRSIGAMGAGGIVGAPLGAQVLTSIDPIIMRKLIGFLALAFTATLASGFRFRARASLHTATAVGVVAGCLGATSALPGPPAILYFLSGPYQLTEARANIIVFLITIQCILICTFLWHDLITKELLLRSLGLAPIYFVAIWIGNHLYGMVNETWFRRISLLIIAATALGAIFY